MMKKGLEKEKQFLSGGGEMGERIRNFDWAKTPLGPPEKWEQSLKTCVRIMLASSQPIWIGWGNELIKLYNDPYKAIVGGKHPHALGQPASVVWKDIWKDIEPLLARVMKKDEGTYVESQLLIMERNNYPEETYYTFSYTPIPGDKGGTAGMICANTDDTARIINERALETLRDLGKLHYSEKTVDEIYAKAALILANNKKDFPSAVFYKIDENKMEARQLAWAGNKKDYEIFPQVIDILNPKEGTLNICKAITSNEIVLSENNGRRPTAPKGFWPVPSKQFLHIPLKVSNKLPVAILSIGLNPFREYDNTYRQFIQLLADQLSLEINNIQVLEEERKRAAALAEIDKAKTVFFNNISHEFRTPLTLMLGPLEELLQQPVTEISQRNLSGISTAHRNAMRLLKLVNTLLDFSRIESGRQQAFFTLIDIAAFTKDLASSFRSVIERAGLKLIVNAEIDMPPVYVDKQMWEKIVFNLLSNAFKYTLNGSITVNLFAKDNQAVLQVTDTGIGIPEEELPHMFERFHRVEGVLGRTYEGTGIGLSMIKELALLNSGTISVESKEGKGSTFTVSIPIGKDHLSADQIKHQANEINSPISNLYIEEASTLLENHSSKHQPLKNEENKKDKQKTTILIVDDNADMREYIRSLLENNYEVITANDGADALRKIKDEHPSLVLSDIMMPVMDGIELLQKIKQDPAISNLPVILLSARAEEESKIKGYDIGADDYLTKPFSSKELMARVSAQLKIAKKRQHTEQQLKNLFLQAPVAICIFRGINHTVEVANNNMLELWGKTAEQVMNKPVFEGLPDAKDQGFEGLLDSVYKTGKRFVAPELPINLFRKGRMEKVFVKFVYEPLYDEDGIISGVMALADEITEQVMARQKIEESETRFRTMAESSDILIATSDETGNAIYFNKAWMRLTGRPVEDLLKFGWADMIHEEDREHFLKTYLSAFEKKQPWSGEFRIANKNGSYSWLFAKGALRFRPDGIFEGYVSSCIDITEQVKALKKAEQSEEDIHNMVLQSPIGICVIDAGSLIVEIVNDSFIEVAGKPYEAIAGKHYWEPFAEAKPYYESALAEVIKEGKPFYADEAELMLIRHGKEEIIYVTFVYAPLKDEEGKVKKVAIWVMENTPQVIARQKIEESEERFRTLSDSLEKQVSERTIELEHKNIVLEKVNKELQSFTYISSHDLQEPLRKIQIFSSRIIENEQKNLSEDGKYKFERIQVAAKRMQMLIEDLLAYSRTTTAEKKMEETDLIEIIDEVKTDLREELQQKNATIETTEMCRAKIIPFQFRQLLQNLISNSLKFSKQGQPPIINIKSEIKNAMRPNDSMPEKQELFCHISVSDNGIGFEQKYSEKIFEVFQRLHGKEQYIGTGVGLAIVKKIVENHNGFITAKSELGKGATFDIYIPCDFKSIMK